MLMWVSIGIRGSNIDHAIETYNLMPEKWFTHALPTLFNSEHQDHRCSAVFFSYAIRQY